MFLASVFLRNILLFLLCKFFLGIVCPEKAKLFNKLLAWKVKNSVCLCFAFDKKVKKAAWLFVYGFLTVGQRRYRIEVCVGIF